MSFYAHKGSSKTKIVKQPAFAPPILPALNDNWTLIQEERLKLVKEKCLELGLSTQNLKFKLKNFVVEDNSHSVYCLLHKGMSMVSQKGFYHPLFYAISYRCVQIKSN